jgi:hypothetical protein
MKKLLLCIMLLSMAMPAVAHNGRKNAEGCHNNHKTGDYHCHGGGNPSSKAPHKANRPKVAVAVKVNHNCETLLSSKKGVWVFSTANLKSKVLVKLPAGTKLVKSGEQSDKSPFFKMQPVGQKTIGFVHKSVVHCP